MTGLGRLQPLGAPFFVSPKVALIVCRPVPGVKDG